MEGNIFTNVLILIDSGCVSILYLAIIYPNNDNISISALAKMAM